MGPLIKFIELEIKLTSYLARFAFQLFLLSVAEAFKPMSNEKHCVYISMWAKVGWRLNL